MGDRVALTWWETGVGERVVLVALQGHASTMHWATDVVHVRSSLEHLLKVAFQSVVVISHGVRLVVGQCILGHAARSANTHAKCECGSTVGLSIKRSLKVVGPFYPVSTPWQEKYPKGKTCCGFTEPPVSTIVISYDVRVSE